MEEEEECVGLLAWLEEHELAMFFEKAREIAVAAGAEWLSNYLGGGVLWAVPKPFPGSGFVAVWTPQCVLCRASRGERIR